MKLTLEKPVYGGDCLARQDPHQVPSQSPSGKAAGKAVFIPLTLPGETVSARIVAEKRTFAKAELETILTASQDRIAPPCPHFSICGGCHYQHANPPAQLALKQQILRETLQRAGVATPAEIQTLSGNPWAYRNRIRLAVTSTGEIGYRGRRSHTIVPIRECPIAAPVLFAIALQINQFLAENPSPAPISEIESFVNHNESEILITLFSEQTPHPAARGTELQDWLSDLHAALPPQVSGLRLQQGDGSLHPPILALSGETSIQYNVAGFTYHVSHGAFFQVNRWLLDDFAEQITAGPEGLLTGQLAWDLYAGVGLFARRLTTSFAEVHAVESAPASLPALEQNLAGTNSQAHASTTLDFLRRNRQQRGSRPDLIILDPARAGLGEETAQLLNAIHAPQIIYVSCDPATLARDLHTLTQERYKLDSIGLVDMFPQTFHIETVVRLSRS